MFIQSILVYLVLMLIMISFGYMASYKTKQVSGEIVLVDEYGSFWQFNTITPPLLFGIVFGMRFDVGVDHLNYMNKIL